MPSSHFHRYFRDKTTTRSATSLFYSNPAQVYVRAADVNTATTLISKLFASAGCTKMIVQKENFVHSLTSLRVRTRRHVCTFNATDATTKTVGSLMCALTPRHATVKRSGAWAIVRKAMPALNCTHTSVRPFLIRVSVRMAINVGWGMFIAHLECDRLHVPRPRRRITLKMI